MSVSSGTRDAIQTNLTGILVKVRGLCHKENCIASKGNDVVVITPLSASSEKKAKPKSITFDKQCLV